MKGKVKSFLEVCSALDCKRRGATGSDWGYRDASTMAEADWSVGIMHASAVREIQELVDAEEFALLLKAKEAIESGYYKFLLNLWLIDYWIRREAEKSAYVEGMTKKELRDFEAKHQRELRKSQEEILKGLPPDKFQEMREYFDRVKIPLVPRIRNTLGETDLPTKRRIEDLHRKVFPNEKRFWKGQSDTSSIWKDAGLEDVPQRRPGDAPLPPERAESLKAFLSD